MKFTILSLAILLLSSCNDIVPKRNSLNNNAQLVENSFGRWIKTSATPMTPLVISSQFSLDEQAAVNDMAIEWEQAANDELDFYTLPLQEVLGLSVIHGYTSLSQYNDSEMGVYKSFDWFEDVSSFALAITQFRGFQRLSGTTNTFIELIHADIIMNYRDWSFSTDNTPFTYDFQSVMLHELGHFIGLPHVFDTTDSIMYPQLNREEVKRVPFAIDDQRLRTNYGLSGGVSAIQAITGSEENQIIDKRGKEVQGYIELRADGSCHHYVNGKLVHKHDSKITKMP